MHARAVDSLAQTPYRERSVSSRWRPVDCVADGDGLADFRVPAMRLLRLEIASIERTGS